MPKYRVPVTRDVTETAFIIVDAETVEEAQEGAIAEARNDAGGNAYSWERDDCYNSERQPYIADPEGFIDLVQDENEKFGEASDLAVIRDALTLLAVQITPAMHPGRRSLIERAQDAALRMANEYRERTDEKLPPRDEYASDSGHELDEAELAAVEGVNAVATNLGDWVAEQFREGYGFDGVRCRLTDAARAMN